MALLKEHYFLFNVLPVATLGAAVDMILCLMNYIAQKIHHRAIAQKKVKSWITYALFYL